MRAQDKIDQIFQRLSNSIGNPKSELEYLSEYTFLVAVVLSAQTTDVQVNKVTRKLFTQYNTIDKVLELGEERLAIEINSIGLYKNKAKNIIALSKILKEKFHSRVPRTREELMSLPGVGRKTANVVLNELFGEPVIAVDTHVLRLSNRLGISNSKDPNKVEEDLMAIVPSTYHANASDLLVLHGRYICKAKSPMCSKCVIYDLCNSKDKQ